MKFLVDANLSPTVAARLTDAGHESTDVCRGSSKRTWRTTTPFGRTEAWTRIRRSSATGDDIASGTIVRRDVLGGLIHEYHRAA